MPNETEWKKKNKSNKLFPFVVSFPSSYTKYMHLTYNKLTIWQMKNKKMVSLHQQQSNTSPSAAFGQNRQQQCGKTETTNAMVSRYGKHKNDRTNTLKRKCERREKKTNFQFKLLQLKCMFMFVVHCSRFQYIGTTSRGLFVYSFIWCWIDVHAHIQLIEKKALQGRKIRHLPSGQQSPEYEIEFVRLHVDTKKRKMESPIWIGRTVFKNKSTLYKLQIPYSSWILFYFHLFRHSP